MSASSVQFAYPDKGSRILREFAAEQQAKRAIAQRQRSDLSRRSFSGAAVGRLTASLQAWSGAINADLDADLEILRARARALCANHEYGRRFLTLVAANVVGPSGPTLQVRAINGTPRPGQQATLDSAANEAIETHWWRWSRGADVAGRMNLGQLLRVAVKAVARDGEALLRPVRDRRLPYGMALQLLEADRLETRLNQRASNGNTIRQGVELDGVGRPVAYWLRKFHPGEAGHMAGTGLTDYERVPAGELWHLFLPERAEQVRGYTWMHAVILRASMLQGYEEAAVVAARVGAAKVAAIRKSLDAAGPEALNTLATGGTDSSGNLQVTAEPGEFFELPPGYELDAWDPEYPHQSFEAFMKTCLRGLAAGLDVDYQTLANDPGDANFSSQRTATIETRETWKILQDWLIESLMMPVYRMWLETALLRGDITFASGSALPPTRFQKFAEASDFQGRRWQWLDPLKDAQTAETLLRNHLASRTEIAAGQGRDFADIVAELAAEERMLRAAGLQAQAPAPAPPAPPPADDEDEDKEDEE